MDVKPHYAYIPNFLYLFIHWGFLGSFHNLSIVPGATVHMVSISVAFRLWYFFGGIEVLI
jgi:hypothetical protein